MKENAAIREIRETRKKISGRFDHNPKRLIDYYKELQKKKVKMNSASQRPS